MRGRSYFRKWTIPLLIFCIAAGASYAHAQSFGGRFIIPEQRIPLGNSGQGTWAGRDATINYRFTTDGAGMAISGTVNFADSIRYNYSRIQSFHADVIFADADGRVIGRKNLMSTRQDNFDPARFSLRLGVPGQAAYFTFSYTGEVVESTGGRGRHGGNPTSIWYTPLTDMPGQKSP